MEIPGVELGAELGRGARTVVYHARRGDREYAVKVLRTGGDARAAAAFHREAALLASLDDPGLARVHEVGEAAGHSYLIMDLMVGTTLADLMRREYRLDEPRAARIASQVADALVAAHRAGLVHRDVKPDNIMISRDGRARLVDFGFATRTGADEPEAAVGTFAYSAPEQTGMLRRVVDERADLYALGVVLFECLTGEPPFQAAETGELIRMHLAVPAPDVRSLRPDVSPAIAAVVATLLAKDPDDRYQSSDGLRADLSRIAAGGLDGFAPDTGGVGTPQAQAIVGRDDELARLIARWRQGHGGVVLVHGPPGSGKTHLVRALTADLAALVLHGTCDAEEALPLAPLRAAVEAYLHAVSQLPEHARREAEQELRTAAGERAGLLRPLSPTLAELLRTPDAPAPDDQWQFADAVASFLVALAGDGAVLHLDSIQWADDATRRVLARLAPLLPGSALLVILTARDDAPEADLRLELGPLDDGAVAALVAGRLGGLSVPPEVSARLAARCGGNPLAVTEYVRAVLDAGLVRPSWGRWELDESGLEALDLPADIMALVLRRVDELGTRGRLVLTAAAATGRRFWPQLLAEACVVEPDAVALVLADATARQLVEPVDGGGYAFLHDRVREALLAELGDDARCRLHQRIAEAWERGRYGGSASAYAVAHHYLRGEPDRAPRRVFTAVAAAGALALAEHAPADAVDFLTRAGAVADAAGLTLDATFHTDLGVAASRVGHFALAHEHLARALDLERDPIRRARLYGLRAEAHHSQWEGDRAVEMAARGLAELGHPLPRNPVVLALTTLALFLAGLVGGRRVTGETRERYRLRAHLADVAAQSAAIAVRLPLMIAPPLRSLYLVKRLGPGPEYANIVSGLAIAARTVGWRRTARRLLARAAAAAPPQDTRLAAHVEYMHGAVLDVTPPTDAVSGLRMRQALDRHGRHLDLGEFLTAAGYIGQVNLLRGYLDEAARWYESGLSRAPASEELLGSYFATLGPQVAALAGRPAEAADKMREIREFLATTPENRGQRINVAVAAVHLAVEQGATGPEFDDAVAEFAALGVRPAMLWSFQRMFWVHQAFGRLARGSLAQAGQAVKALGRAANGPVLQAYHQAAQASLRQRRGDHTGALRRLARLQARAGGLDLPLLGYECERVRARAHRALGHEAEADRAAAVALMLATEHGWHGRARRVRAEFAVKGHTAGRSLSSTLSRDDGSRRRLDALQQVSLAAATVLDPDQLIRVALDETVRIFGAERAYLFLRGDFLGEPGAADRLLPYVGRDAGGTDLDRPTGYGSTLVERVRAGGEPIVVTGSEEGAALGSRSTVVHDLRSIMVAPLTLKGRLLGVIYLDSRAAKGIFTTDDIDILTALSNHVALALETARAAQLELAVRAAQRERDLAETLRQAMTGLTASLEPDEVGRCLTATVARVLPVDVVALLRRERDGRLTVPAATGAPPTGPVTVDPTLAGLLAATGPVRGTRAEQPPPLPDVLGHASGAWLAVPLLVREQHHGLLLAASAAARPYTDAETEIAAALASQGVAALDNAVLFQQVQNLAARDGLTDLFNRRHFLDVGRDRLGDGAVAAVMVDIDHFKRINDTYGHGVGDEVIREVARRLAGCLRGSDLICRYGGEEYAILLPDTSWPDADRVAHRLHLAVAERPVSTEAGDLAVTVSVGVAVPTDRSADLVAMLSHADDALYQAKRAGRNRVVALAEA